MGGSLTDHLGTTAMDFDAAAEELYSAPPGEFVTRRKALAAQAKSDGDRSLAKQITALRKPTRAASLLNTWVRDDSDGVAAIADLAADLAAAQRRPERQRLQALAARRQTLVESLAQQVVDRAVDAGETVSDAVARELVSTLRAAIADPTVYEALRLARLDTAAEYSGFGPVSMFLVTGSDPPPLESQSGRPVAADADDGDPVAEASPTEASRSVDRGRRERAVAELSAAEEQVVAAERRLAAAAEELDGYGTALAAASAEAEALAERAEELRGELREVEEKLRFTARRLDGATDRHRKAAEHRDAAQEALAAARTVLARLGEEPGL